MLEDHHAALHSILQGSCSLPGQAAPCTVDLCAPTRETESVTGSREFLKTLQSPCVRDISPAPLQGGQGPAAAILSSHPTQRPPGRHAAPTILTA